MTPSFYVTLKGFSPVETKHCVLAIHHVGCTSTLIFLFTFIECLLIYLLFFIWRYYLTSNFNFVPNGGRNIIKECNIFQCALLHVAHV